MNNRSNAILVYARMGSSRLPGKALMSLGEILLLELIIKRLQTFNNLVDADIILATTENQEDDELVKLAAQLNISIHRGDEQNVIKRTVQFFQNHDYKNFLRVNGDCPLVDKNVIINGYKHLRSGYDFVTNIKERTFPYGISVEWMNVKTFQKLASTASIQELEHVTLHLYRQINNINHLNISNEINLSHTRFVIDTVEDLNQMKKLIEHYSISELINLSYESLIIKHDYDNVI